MLKNHYYSKWAIAKVVFVLPFVALLLMLNCKPKQAEPETITYNINLENMGDELSGDSTFYDINITQNEDKTQEINIKKVEKPNKEPNADGLELVPEGADVFFLDKDGNVDTSFKFSWVQEEESLMRTVEEMPEPIGGWDAMYKSIRENITYPAEAKEKGISGQVFLEFVVEKDGTISHVKVLSGVHPDLDAEAVRVIQLLPKWKPGKQNGKPVRCFYSIPIRFSVN